MFRHSIRHFIWAIIWLFGVQTTAYSKDITCETLVQCEAAVINALTVNRDSASNYYDISRAFTKFDQAGFDALFEMIERAAGDNRLTLLAALSYMKDDQQNSFTFEISKLQYDTLTQMWSREPDYSLAGLINYADTAASHAFMIKALQSKQKGERHWAEQAIRIGSFGKGTSPVDAKHLPDILKLIQTDNLSVMVPVLERINSPKATLALWQLLEDDDRWIFYEAFEILLEADEAKVYEILQGQSFVDMSADKQRALMIAETIRSERHRIKPAAQAYHFWKNWYEAADTSDTEKIIPAYLLFDLFEKTKSEVEGADKYIEDRERWRGFTQANPEGRTGYLSVEHLNREIAEKRAEVSRLTPLLQLQTARLMQNEKQTLNDYFRIFDAQRSYVNEMSYEYGGDDYLPFPQVLEAAMQTDALWAETFWTYIDDGPFAENTSIVEKITALETDRDKLKTFYLERLNYTDNIPKLLGTLVLISSVEALRTDRDIINAVNTAVQNTPFTKLTIAANYALSDTLHEQGANPYIFFGWGSPLEDVMIAANAKRKYCRPTSRGHNNYMAVTPDLHRPLQQNYNQLGKAAMTVQTPSGYLSGHNRGEFGGGLIYYSDVTAEGKLLPLKYARNVISIVESNTEGVYWVLAGLNHLMPGLGAIYEVDARTDNVSVEPHKRLPAVPRETSFLKNGYLYMDFTAKSYTTIDMDNDVEMVHKIDNEKYNPPVNLTKDGDLISACED